MIILWEASSLYSPQGIHGLMSATRKSCGNRCLELRKKLSKPLRLFMIFDKGESEMSVGSINETDHHACLMHILSNRKHWKRWPYYEGGKRIFGTVDSKLRREQDQTAVIIEHRQTHLHFCRIGEKIMAFKGLQHLTFSVSGNTDRGSHQRSLGMEFHVLKVLYMYYSGKVFAIDNNY